MHPLDIHRPALPPKQHVNTAIAIAHAGLGNFLDPVPERRLVASDRPIAVRLAIEPENRAATPLTHPITVLRPMDDLPKSARRYTFFARTSWSMALSSDRSATSRFSFWFSSSSWRILRSSDRPRPPYSCFQLMGWTALPPRSIVVKPEVEGEK